MKHDSVVIYYTLRHNQRNLAESGFARRQQEKGNAERVAQAIAAVTQAPLLELRNQELFPPTYQEVTARALIEINTNAYPALREPIPSTSYQTIYLSLPYVA